MAPSVAGGGASAQRSFRLARRTATRTRRSLPGSEREGSARRRALKGVGDEQHVAASHRARGRLMARLRQDGDVVSAGAPRGRQWSVIASTGAGGREPASTYEERTDTSQCLVPWEPSHARVPGGAGHRARGAVSRASRPDHAGTAIVGRRTVNSRQTGADRRWAQISNQPQRPPPVRRLCAADWPPSRTCRCRPCTTARSGSTWWPSSSLSLSRSGRLSCSRSRRPGTSTPPAWTWSSTRARRSLPVRSPS